MILWGGQILSLPIHEEQRELFQNMNKGEETPWEQAVDK